MIYAYIALAIHSAARIKNDIRFAKINSYLYSHHRHHTLSPLFVKQKGQMGEGKEGKEKKNKQNIVFSPHTYHSLWNEKRKAKEKKEKKRKKGFLVCKTKKPFGFSSTFLFLVLFFLFSNEKDNKGGK